MSLPQRSSLSALKRNNVARGHHLLIVIVIVSLLFLSAAHLKATRGKCDFWPSQCGEQQMPSDETVLQVRVHTVVLLSADLMLHCIREAKPF